MLTLFGRCVLILHKINWRLLLDTQLVKRFRIITDSHFCKIWYWIIYPHVVAVISHQWLWTRLYYFLVIALTHSRWYPVFSHIITWGVLWLFHFSLCDFFLFSWVLFIDCITRAWSGHILLWSASAYVRLWCLGQRLGRQFIYFHGLGSLQFFLRVNIRFLLCFLRMTWRAWWFNVFREL